MGANRLLACLALGYFLVQWLPSFLRTYGYFIDEFYYLACANHLALGFVDQPPLSIALLALVRGIAGDSLPALRFVPALSGGAAVLLTGLLARRLGAGTFGQALAAGALMAGAISMVIFGYYSMNALDILFWLWCFWILVDLEEHGRTRDWLLLGLALGLGLENKHTLILLVLGLVPGMLLSKARRHFVQPGFWMAMAVAGMLLAPNLVWQIQHGWPSLEFYVNADVLKNNPTPPFDVLLQQVMFMNPAALPIWLGGLVFLLGRGHEGKLRHLAWVYVVLLLLLALGQQSRPDRLVPAYSILFAAGGVALDSFVRRRRALWLRPVMAASLVLFSAVLAPLGFPVLPPAVVASYGAKLGIVPQIEGGEGKRSALPQWLADRMGWERLTDDVERVVRALPPGEAARAIILAPSYGQAGALEFFGRGRKLPPVYATHNNYHLWGPPPRETSTVIALGYSEGRLRERFEQVSLAGIHHCEWCMRWRDDMPISIARHPRTALADHWQEMRHFE